MSRHRKNFLSAEQLDEAAIYLSEVAEEQNTAIAIAGGYAMSLYGSPRLTADLDVVAEKMIRDLPRGKRLSIGGRTTKAPNGVPLDIIVRGDKYQHLYQAALVERTSAGDLAIVTPEYLAIMKMVAARPQDDIDLKFLIKNDTLNIEFTKCLIEDHLGIYAVDEFERVLDEAEWELAREGQ